MARNDRRYPRGPLVGFPERVESQYLSEVERYVRDLVRAVEALQPEEPREDSREDVSIDAWLIAIRRLRVSIDIKLPGLDKIAAAVDGYQTAQQKKAIMHVAPASAIPLIEQALAPPAAGMRKAWVRQNVRLIKTVDARYFNEIERLVEEGIASGRSVKDIGREIARRGGVAESRGRLIARDQVAKLNSQITQRRQKDVGITHYIWRTVGDERVRPSHAAKDGVMFAYDKPPPDTGHPGSDIQCRCIAEPVFEP